VRGEWFRLTDEQVEAIKGIKGVEAPGGGGGKPLQVCLDHALTTAMQEYLESLEPHISKTAYIEALIRADMRARGKLPPRTDQPPAK
jgi:hypothetical protein